MGRVSGLVQGVRYSGTSQRLWHRLIADGVESVVKTAEKAKITIYDPSGDSVLAASDMTQSGSTHWWYYDLNASDTDAYDYGYDYLMLVTWNDDGSLARRSEARFDVVPEPCNDPLIASEEIDDMHPAWAGARHGSWTDWTPAIFQAHIDLHRFMRDMRDNEGQKVYLTRVIDRYHLREAEMALARMWCLKGGMQCSPEAITAAETEAQSALNKLGSMYLDTDDDRAADEKEMFVQRQWRR